MMELRPLSSFTTYQNEFITIDDEQEYKRITARLHRKGLVLRDVVKGSEIKTKRQQICRTNQLLVAEIDAKVGGYGIVPKELEGSIVSSHYFLFNIRANELLPDYLGYVLKTDHFFSQINAQGSTNYAAIRPKGVLKIGIPYCSVNLQKQIVEKLNSLTGLRSQFLDNVLMEKDEVSKLREAILQEGVSGKLVSKNPNDEPTAEFLTEISEEKEKAIGKKKTRRGKELRPISEEEIPYELPRGWVWTRLGEIATVTMGQSPKGDSYNTQGKGTPLINGPVEFSNGSFGFTVMSKWTTAPTKLCQKDDILICVRGSTTGRTNIAGFDSCIGRGVASIQPYANKKYVHYYLLYSEKTIFNLGIGGTTFPNITLDELNGLIFPLPPLSEQRRIAEKLDQLMGLCGELEETVKKSHNNSELLMKVVLKEAFAA